MSPWTALLISFCYTGSRGTYTTRNLLASLRLPSLSMPASGLPVSSRKSTCSNSLHLYEPLGMAVPFIKLAADNGNLYVSEVLPSEASVLIISSCSSRGLTFSVRNRPGILFQRWEPCRKMISGVAGSCIQHPGCW
jgi:hypothetical protein